MNTIIYSPTTLIGGAATALDYIDGTDLVDGDFAHVAIDGVIYVYKLNASSGAAEASPWVIAPDTNAGNKRWILQLPADKGYVKVSDVKAQNTSGGTFTAGAWRTRDINTEDTDTAGICAIASNQITLQAGTYDCLIFCPVGESVNTHQSRLYNITDGAATLIGQVGFTTSAGGYSGSVSIISGRFTITAQKVFEIQHYCSATASTYGFGRACNFTSEIYTIAEFWRRAI
jgi:hypothetical protein